MRVAIYARISTDHQNQDSPSDQIARCKDLAAARGLDVVDQFVVVDSGISGASRHNRPQLLALFDQIRSWDVLLCWEFSRLARDSEDLGWIRNQLRLHRKTAYEASTGLDIFNVGSKVMGILNEEYLVKLRADTRRGLQGRVERKMFAGGTPYGYRTEPIPSGQTDPHGNPVPAGYKLVIDPEQAVVVRRIYEEYLSGEGFRAVAGTLNAGLVPSPRGKGWALSAIRSLVMNPIYKGEYIWGKTEWIKDHETGIRKKYPRPESEWVRRYDPEWIIVDEETWEAAQATQRKRARAFREGGAVRGVRGRRGHPPRYLLSGLLSCGVCGGAVHVLDHRKLYGCSWNRDRGDAICANTMRIRCEAIRQRVVSRIQTDILTPEAIRYLVERATQIAKERLVERDLEAERVRLAQIEEELENLVRMAARLGKLEAYEKVLADLEQERQALKSSLAAAPPVVDPETLRDEIEAYTEGLEWLLKGDDPRVRAGLRHLLQGQRIEVHPEVEERDGFRLEADMLLFASPLSRPSKENETLEDDPERLVRVVAGGGFEPPASGL